MDNNGDVEDPIGALVDVAVTVEKDAIGEVIEV
jgi:hypothetical protein